MNILLMISKNDRYGAQRTFLDQVKVLRDMGNHVVVVGRGSEGFVPDAVMAMGVEYHGIAMTGLKDIFLLRQLIKKYNIKVIHTALDRADYFGVLLSVLSRKPVVSTMMVPRYHLGFKFADRVVVLSNKQKGLLEGRGVKPGKIAVIRPGIDVERFAQPDTEKQATWRQRLGVDQFTLILCHIASLIPRKAHSVSLDLVAACKKRDEKPLLIIIGDPLQGEYYERLIQKIGEMGLKDNVHFTGWTSDIPEILSLSHYTVLPSEGEALGLVLMEGMAAGTPVIARAGEGGAELIEDYQQGFLYRPDIGVAELAEAVCHLHHDGSRYEVSSRRCREIAVDDFSLRRFGERLLGVYENASKAVRA